MARRKQSPKATGRTRVRTTSRARDRRPHRASSGGYRSASWERVNLLSMDLDALARALGLHDRERDPDGFDLLDAAREMARLAANHHKTQNPDGRTPAQERDDWVALAGVGADVGNMADEPEHAGVAGGVRAVAYEVCYLVCDHLF